VLARSLRVAISIGELQQHATPYFPFPPLNGPLENRDGRKAWNGAFCWLSP